MYDQELAAGLDAVNKACSHLLVAYADFQAIPDAPADITTEADRQTQEILLQHMLGIFPNDAFSAEENTVTLKNARCSGDRLWIIDPIDGTRGFAQKNGEFSVMVALVDEKQIGVGIVAQPTLGRLTYAVRGGGCWRRDKDAAMPTRCRVTATARLDQATLVQSRSRDANKPSRWVKALGPAKIIETHSAGVKLALVARGEADLYLNTYDAFHDWDICAGHILVSEAGGKVTGTAGQSLVYGAPGAWQRHGLLASNGKVHEVAIEGINRCSPR